MSFAVGNKVEVTGRGIHGIVAFVGNTEFAEGKWIGVVLEEPKGKNNGTVQGVKYFTCKEHHGIFVRQTQLVIIDDKHSSPKPQATTTGSSVPVQSNIPSVSKIPTTQSDNAPTLSSGLPKFAPKEPPSSGAPNIPKPTIPAEISTPQKTSAVPQKPQTLPTKPRDREVQDLEASAADFMDKRKASITAAPSEFAMPKTPSTMSTSFSGIPARKPSDSSSNNQVLIDELMAKNRDLEEKLDTLKFKRSEDRSKLIQLQQLIEFKNKMQTEHAELQRQLQKSKNELKETQESFEKYKEDMSTAADNIEMAMLDKEMAEEKADLFEQENVELQERVVDLEKQVNSMKEDLAAMASTSTGGTSSGSNAAVISYQLKQAEEQNVKLKEAVIRLRDLNKSDRERIEVLEKSFEQKEKIIEDTRKEREKMMADIQNLEDARLALTEQVDAAMGATEMVEHLTRKNMDLEDQVAALEEERHELEQLRDVDQQIQEELKHVEIQLREEVDMVQASRHELLMKLNTANDQLADAETMLSRFRQLVASLREEAAQLRLANVELTEQASTLQQSAEQQQQQKVASPQKSEQISKSRAVNLQIRQSQIQHALARIEANYLKRYCELLMPFLPESWYQTKSLSPELTAIGSYSALIRIIEKSKMISAKISEWFGDWSAVSVSESGPWSRNDVLQNSESQQINFSASVSMLCAELSLNGSQLLAIFDALLADHAVSLLCSLSTDIHRLENSIDGFIEKMKSNQIDETTSLEALSQPVETLKRFCESHLNSATADRMAHFGDSVFVSDYFHLMETVAQAVLCASSQMSPLIPADLHIVPPISAALNLKGEAKSLLIASRRGARQLGHLESDKRINLDAAMRSKFLSTCQLAVRISGMMRHTTTSVFRLVASNEAETGSGKKPATQWQLSVESFNECAASACHSVFSAEDAGIAEHCRQLSDVVEAVKSLSVQLGPDSDSKIVVQVGTNPLPSIQLRAGILRTEAAENRLSRQKLETRDGEVTDLKKSLKLSHDDIDQLNTKIGLLERRIESAGRDSEAWEHKYEDQKIQIVAQQNEAERTLDVYQRQIGQLQAERQELQEKLVAITRRQPVGQTQQVASPATEAAQVSQVSQVATQAAESRSVPISSSSVRDSPMLLARIADLESALKQLLVERSQLKMKIAGERLAALKPIRSSAQGFGGGVSVPDNVVKQVVSVHSKLVTELAEPMRRRDDASMSAHKLKWMLSQRALRLRALQDAVHVVSNRVAKKCPNLEKSADGSSVLAEIDVNCKPSDEVTRPVVSLNVTLNQFNQIHNAFSASTKS